METRENTDHAVADEVERFIREVGQVSEDDVDFTRQVQLFCSGYLDSLGVAQLIAYIEEEFQLELSDDELSDPAFQSIDGISAIVEAALRERLGSRRRISR
ncbi:MAG TPA: phosphopantetheine-binding protein [Trebonia sp.]